MQVAGPVLSFRRPSPPFAFVEYGEAESVLRCLEVVNSASIKMPSGAEKQLLVKADEKTRSRLDEYEKERVQNQVCPRSCCPQPSLILADCETRTHSLAGLC